MKTTKLVIGIISIVLTFVILMQSCAAGVGDAILNKGGTSAISGFFTAVVLLVSGIVAIAARDSRGATLFCSLMYALAGLVGLSSSGVYGDLKVWGGLSVVFAVVFFVHFLQMKRRRNQPSVVADNEGRHA